MNLGILGGTFNPVHLAHLHLGEEAREALDLERVLFVPAGDPPLKPACVAPPAQRRAMLERALASNPAFEVCDIELQRAGPSYTVDTIEALASRHRDARLWFLLGADTLPDLEAWHRPERLFELASFAVATRPGTPGSPLALMPRRLAAGFRETAEGWRHASGNVLCRLELTPLSISASDIRQRIAAGASVRYLVPDEVIEYIQKHRLYEGASDEQGASSHGGSTR